METAEVECMADECDWAGNRDETFCRPHDPDDLFCPEYGTRLTESEEAPT